MGAGIGGLRAGRWARVLCVTLLGWALALGSVSAQAAKAPNKKNPPAASAKKPAKGGKANAPRAAANRSKAAQRPAAKRPAASRTKAAAAKPRANTRQRVKRAAAAGAAGAAAVAVARPSFGQMAGLHHASDPLALQSSVAFVMDQETKEVLLSKNDQAVLPIASITKLMTGLIITEARLPMDQLITITQDDVDTVKRSSSRLRVGATLSRKELLHLALMSSENRAAHALGRTYPGGLNAFVRQMNIKAKLLGMTHTRFVDPTGLSSNNQSSARDLATLVNVTHGNPVLRTLSTSTGTEVEIGNRTLRYNNTNRLVRDDDWEIGLQKTGYISEAGRCLVMQAEIAGRKLIMVFLDSVSSASRLADAQRVRQWVQSAQARH